MPRTYLARSEHHCHQIEENPSWASTVVCLNFPPDPTTPLAAEQVNSAIPELDAVVRRWKLMALLPVCHPKLLMQSATSSLVPPAASLRRHVELALLNLTQRVAR